MRSPLVCNETNHTLGRITAQGVSRLANIVGTKLANLSVTTVVKIIADLAIKIGAGINYIQCAQAPIYGQRKALKLVIKPVGEKSLNLQIAHGSAARLII